MSETKDKDLIFQEKMDVLVDTYGIGNQEGIKACLTECQDMFHCVSTIHQQQITELFELDKQVIGTMIKFMPSIKESIVEYEVVCCSGSRCAKNGSIEVLKAIKENLGIDVNGTTIDGRIRLSTQNCFKKCNLGPNIMVNGKLYSKMDKVKSLELIKSIKK